MRNLSRVSQLYILGSILLGGLGVIWSIGHLELAYPPALLIACVLATLSQILKIEGTTARSSYSLSWVVYAAVFVSMGWPEMLITIIVAHLGEWLRHRYPWYIQSFNIAVYSITSILAGLIYHGLTALSPEYNSTTQAFAVLIAMLVFMLVNHLLIGLVIKLARNQSFRESGVFTLTTLTIDFGLLCLGVSAAIVVQTNLAAIVFLIVVAITFQMVLHMPALEREAEHTAELARASHAKYEFVATMNHELRTPLNAVMLYAESLQRKLPGPLNARQERAVQAIRESAEHLLLIINDILDVAKIDAGKLEINITSTDIETACQSSLLLVSEMAQKKQIGLHYFRNPNVIHLDVDERRLKQILVNLLSNAIKFTPVGGKVGLEVDGDTENDVVHFEVWDTGIGISQENIKKLFQPFVQIDFARTPQHAGSGLGLFLVRRMVELHGGNVAVTSEADKGSHFTVSLPWHQKQPRLSSDVRSLPALGQPKPSHADSMLGKELADQPTTITIAPIKVPATPLGRMPAVLIADDNDANLSVLSDFLQEWHCQILFARTGLEAVEKAKNEHPDLIFMDIQMPVMDGLQAIRRIRNEPLIRHIPIVVLTAFATLKHQEDSLAIGADAFLSKPIQFVRLTEVLHTHLGNIVAKDQL